MLSDIAITILLGFSNILGVHALPQISDDTWHVDEAWTKQPSGSYLLRARSTQIPAACLESRQSVIEFPAVIHGAHRLFVDGNLVASFGDPTFETTRSIYGTMIVECESLPQGREIVWEVLSYSRYFARIGAFPKLIRTYPMTNVFQETIVAIAAGSLWVLGLVSMLLFWERVPHVLTLSVVAVNVLFSFYFMASVPSFFGIRVPMLLTHKVADISLWFGSFFLILALSVRGLVGWPTLVAYGFVVIFSSIVIGTGDSGDTIQVGTMIPMLPFFCVAFYMLHNLMRQTWRQGWNRGRFLQILALSSFVLMAVNDAAAVMGLHTGPVLLSIGIVGGVLCLALDVNQRIVEAYTERDYLRINLQNEVDRKTSELRDALAALKATQADLIQSSKMASLGTLSAGIAHEVNNSLNYVKGALIPLKKLILGAPEEDGRSRQLKLIGVMEEGLTLTLDIMTNLRTFSGLNHARLKEHKVGDLVRSVLTILRRRIPPEINLEIDIPPDLEVLVNAAGINQVLMNLVVNGVDAMQGKGNLKITAQDLGEHVEICVEDSGPGIPDSMRDKIFDPFFTTKDVGQGTGLGLHICRTEVARHGGVLDFVSKPGQGCTFYVRLPHKRAEAA